MSHPANPANATDSANEADPAESRPAGGDGGTGAVAFDRVKCVVWDLDGTLWDGVAVESESEVLPAFRPWALRTIDQLAERGVLSSIASRTAPSVLDALRADAEVAERFVAPQVGWQDKSESLRLIAEELGIGVDALLLVDDSPYERAEVGTMLPGVAAIAPEQVPELLDGLGSGPLTADARERVRRYRTEAVRKDAGRQFAGTREEFLRSCEMRLSVGTASDDDLPRAVELATRTHRLNSSGLPLDAGRVRKLTAHGGHSLLVARLEDRFGEYGLIGAALVEHTADTWWVRLLALSCRVAGRGVSLGFLRWLMDRAAESGAAEFRVDSRPTSANVELRLLFRQAGLRVTDDARAEGGPVTLGRSLEEPLPEHPSWLDITGR
ncbi:HAD-IIIC family phosphatase [Streptomyces sp. NPDC001922]|uniref:HAD-IIIC family phosphatase n=1 Tax=Streptomyces sp. NPDC001922 TaxID=3364624 RepID=UPI003698D812